MQRVVKPTTRKGKKVLQAREPKLIEDQKNVLFLFGRKTSQKITNVMEDIYHLKKPDAKMLSRKHDILPFENEIPLESLLNKHNSSLFFYASHNKKRPDNLVIGRMFDRTLLDMFEFGVDDFKSLQDFKNSKVTLGIKPCIVFQGSEWDQIPNLVRLKSLLTDSFQRDKVQAVRLQGIEHVLSFTVLPVLGDETEQKITNFDISGKILVRSYKILLKKSGCRTPRIELEEIGPSIDLSVRRTKLASDDLFKQACRQPKELIAKPKKNITTNKLGTTLGRIHMGNQTVKIRKLQTRKMKGLRKTPAEKKEMRRKRAASGENVSQSKRIKLST